MSRFRGSRASILAAMAFLVGPLLLLSCQPSQPVATPKPAEKAAEKVAATPVKPVEKPVRGGTLRISAPGEPGSLDPNTYTGMPIYYSVYEQLVEPDKDINLTKEGLAKDWTIGGDGKTITFKLREGVKFHDGTDFNAAAVKFNIDRMKDPASKSPFAEYYISVPSVEVVDNLTVRFNLSQPDVLLLPRLAGGAGGLMVSPAAVKKYGVDFARNPVGTGPFQFVEWKAGDHVTLKRSDGYWQKDKDGNRLPYLDGVVFQVITDPTVATANVRTGQIDLVAKQPSVPVELQPAIKKDPNLTYQIRPASGVSGFQINTQRAPFDNKAVRQAVALALDREGLAGEDSIPYATIFNPVDKAYDDGKSGFPAQDLAKAKAKMAEAGYPSGGLKVKYTSGTTDDALRDAQIVQVNLAQVGIGVEIEALASAAHNTKVRQQKDYQISSAGTGIGVGDPGAFMRVYWHSQGSRNYTNYSNPKFDEAMDKASVTYDQKQRASFYQQAAKILVDDAPYIVVKVTNGFAAMNKKVRDFIQYWDNMERTRDVWLAP